MNRTVPLLGDSLIIIKSIHCIYPISAFFLFVSPSSVSVATSPVYIGLLMSCWCLENQIIKPFNNYIKEKAKTSCLKKQRLLRSTGLLTSTLLKSCSKCNCSQCLVCVSKEAVSTPGEFDLVALRIVPKICIFIKCPTWFWCKESSNNTLGTQSLFSKNLQYS